MTDRDHSKLRFRAPLEASPPTLGALLERAWPEGTDAQRARLVEDGQVYVDERLWRDLKRAPAEESVVELRLTEPGQDAYGLPEGNELERGEGWILVDKPTGMPGPLDRSDPMNPVLFLADMLGLDRDTFAPAWEMPTRAGGPWLFGMTDEDAARLAEAWRSGEMMLTWVALAPRFELPRGQLLGPGKVPINYAVTRYEEGLCELQLIPEYGSKYQIEDAPGPVEVILQALADANHPALGDRLRGGHMVDGGLRLRLAAIMHEPSGIGHSWPAPSDWWPEAPVVHWVDPRELEEEPVEVHGDDEVEPARGGRRGGVGRPTLRVSSKTLEILAGQGHPWVLEDAQTGKRDHLKPGTIVRLQDRNGVPGPWALVEGRGKLAARAWAEVGDDAAVDDFRGEVEIRVDEAIARRAELFRDLTRTDLFRVIHGEADGLPGLLIDRVGPLLRATITGHCSRSLRKIVYASILESDPHITLLEIDHTEDVRQRGELPVARVIHEGGFAPRARRVVGLEDGLKYWCEPWEGIDVGFFADQRENRRKLVEFAAPGQRWLNLFGHTGAFSVALASRGAAVVNVDVSQRYLDWTAENFALNGLDAALDVGVCEDARTFVAATDERYDGIIVDPPTAAQGKAGFWSVRRDFARLLTRCFELLTPGGVMLACRNDRKGRGGLDDLLRECAAEAGFEISSLELAPPAPDYPRLEGFPEGDPFEGWLVR